MKTGDPLVCWEKGENSNGEKTAEESGRLDSRLLSRIYDSVLIAGNLFFLPLFFFFWIFMTVLMKCTEERWLKKLYAHAAYSKQKMQRSMMNTDKGKNINRKNIVKYVRWYTPEKEAAYPTSFKIDFEGQPHEGACEMEHAVCQESYEALKTLLAQMEVFHA